MKDYMESPDVGNDNVDKALGYARELLEPEEQGWLDKSLSALEAWNDAPSAVERYSGDWEKTDNVIDLAEKTRDVGLIVYYAERTSGFNGPDGGQATAEQKALNEAAHELVLKGTTRGTGPEQWAANAEQRDVFGVMNTLDGAAEDNLSKANRITPEKVDKFSGQAPAYLQGLPEEELARIYSDCYADKPYLWLETFPNSGLVPAEDVEAYAESVLLDLRQRGLDGYNSLPFDLCDDRRGFLLNPNLSNKTRTKIARAFYNKVLDNPWSPRQQEMADKFDEALWRVNGPGMQSNARMARERWEDPRNYEFDSLPLEVQKQLQVEDQDAVADRETDPSEET